MTKEIINKENPFYQLIAAIFQCCWERAMNIIRIKEKHPNNEIIRRIEWLGDEI